MAKQVGKRKSFLELELRRKRNLTAIDEAELEDENEDEGGGTGVGVGVSAGVSLGLGLGEGLNERPRTPPHLHEQSRQEQGQGQAFVASEMTPEMQDSGIRRTLGEQLEFMARLEADAKAGTKRAGEHEGEEEVKGICAAVRDDRRPSAGVGSPSTTNLNSDSNGADEGAGGGVVGGSSGVRRLTRGTSLRESYEELVLGSPPAASTLVFDSAICSQPSAKSGGGAAGFGADGKSLEFLVTKLISSWPEC